MDKAGLIILLFLAQLALLLGIITREYHHVQLLKTWTEAQSYCRENFADLATIETVEDWTVVRAMMQSKGGNAWIGLYNDYQSWRWSMNNAFLYGDGNTGLGAWFVFDEDNYKSIENCGQFYLGKLNDCQCSEAKKSVCYDEPTNTYIPVMIPMNWSSAQSYCRNKYTDLTSIRNQQENEKILSVIDQSDHWVGLFRYGWVWSDQSKSSFRQWDRFQPVGGLGRCAHVQTGGFVDVQCGSKLPFICSAVPTLKLFKIVLMTKGPVDLNDLQVQEGVLNYMKKQMRDNGIHHNFLLSWRNQPNGPIFMKKTAQLCNNLGQCLGGVSQEECKSN